MKCTDARPLLDLLCDGALDAKDCALVLDHMKSCGDCQHEWQELEHLRAEFQEAKGATKTPAGLMERISEKLREEEKKEQRNFLQSSTAKISFLAIAASIALVGLLLSPLASTLWSGPRVQSVNSAFKLIDDASSELTAQTVDDKQQLAKDLGYELKYINLPSWTMSRSALYQGTPHPAIARFDFVRSTPSGLEHLTCYQGRAGSIATASGPIQQLDGKAVHFGHHGKYEFALWSQNGRDYLFITTLAREELESIVRGA